MRRRRRRKGGMAKVWTDQHLLVDYQRKNNVPAGPNEIDTWPAVPSIVAVMTH